MMGKWLLLATLILGGLSRVQAKDSLSMPSGAEKVKTRGDQVEVQWPYGTVIMPAQSLSKPAPAQAAKPRRPRAWTKGIFDFRYELVRDGDFLKAGRVSVTVKNKTSFHGDESPALKTHEDMHRRINETEAQKIENNLSGFRYKMIGNSGDLQRADALIRRQFRSQVQEVNQLHKDWDKNQIP